MTAPATPRTSVLTDADLERIERGVAQAPPLTPEQRDRLTQLLRPVRLGGAA